MSALLSAPLIMPTEETAALSLVMCRVTELQITCVVFVSSHVLLQTFKKKKKVNKYVMSSCFSLAFTSTSILSHRIWNDRTAYSKKSAAEISS